jgi:glyoxylase-like metal-dependent hydrolase (beta-lactamase superfamily II)
MTRLRRTTMKVMKVPTGGMAVNTYYVAAETINHGFIIDPGGYDYSLVKKIKEADVSIKYIILTHGHHDHMGGVNDFLGEYPDAKLVACVHEKSILENPNANFSNYFGGSMTLNPDIFVDNGDTLEVGELTLKFIHTPGHTPGGLCIYVGGVLFSGDTLFRQSIGRTDFPGSSFADLKKAINEKLYTLPEHTKVYPGHMEETDIGFEKRNNPFV